MPQVAIAQSGSFFSTSRNACSPALYQNECSIATAREIGLGRRTAGVGEGHLPELAFAHALVRLRRAAECKRRRQDGKFASHHRTPSVEWVDVPVCTGPTARARE